MNNFLELTTALSQVVFGIMILFTLYWAMFGLIVLASKLKKDPIPPKYEIISLGGVYWVIKRTDVPKYYNHKTRDFNNLRYASKYDSEELAYLNMVSLK